MKKIIVKQMSQEERIEMNIPDEPQAQGPWNVWECSPSIFDWHYDDTEKAYIYEGKVVVKTSEQEVEIKAGDFVIFPGGLDCTWAISEKVRKVYKFE